MQSMYLELGNAMSAVYPWWKLEDTTLEWLRLVKARDAERGELVVHNGPGGSL